MKYTAVLRSKARQLGYKLEISSAELVRGSLNPPPSSRFPGRFCFLVTVRAGPALYSGYGRTPRSAKTAAEHEALVGLQRQAHERREAKYAAETHSTASNVSDSDLPSRQSPPPHPLLVMMQQLGSTAPVANETTATTTSVTTGPAKTDGAEGETSDKTSYSLSAGPLEDFEDSESESGEDSDDVEYMEEWEEEEEEEEEEEGKKETQHSTALPTEGPPFFTLI